ncbi:hypothetical protein ACFP9V_01490 [Deinococcus radiopugnans]|uniref:hypothetical protein n=1 Tax=Deinococcus radiopugnans TaxID=57497 RepID=UPI00360E9DC1
MTDDPAAREVRAEPEHRQPARPAARRRWPWAVLGLLAVLALVVVFSPPCSAAGCWPAPARPWASAPGG